VTAGDFHPCRLQCRWNLHGQQRHDHRIGASTTITVAAAPNTKVFDGTTSAAAVPTIISGTLVAGDTPDFMEAYTTPRAGARQAPHLYRFG